MTPLSSKGLPSYTPLHTTGLPGFQSETTSVSGRYCAIVCGSISAAQTVSAGAATSTAAVATSPLLIRRVPPVCGRGRRRAGGGGAGARRGAGRYPLIVARPAGAGIVETRPDEATRGQRQGGARRAPGGAAIPQRPVLAGRGPDRPRRALLDRQLGPQGAAVVRAGDPAPPGGAPGVRA